MEGSYWGGVDIWVNTQEWAKTAQIFFLFSAKIILEAECHSQQQPHFNGQLLFFKFGWELPAPPRRELNHGGKYLHISEQSAPLSMQNTRRRPPTVAQPSTRHIGEGMKGSRLKSPREDSFEVCFCCIMWRCFFHLTPCARGFKETTQKLW